MGIAIYTLTISVIADAFLSSTMKSVMGLGKLHKKKIVVIGDSSACREVIGELVRNGLEDETGWITSETPKSPPKVDYITGEYNEETLRRGGVDKAEHVVLCLNDDSKTLHTALLIRKLNKRARLAAVVLSNETGDLLKEAGVDYVLTEGLIGRIAASAIFEPLVVTFLSDVTTASGYADLIEYDVSEKDRGKRIIDVEAMLDRKTGDRHRVLYLYRKGEHIYAPNKEMKLEKGDRLVILRAYKHRAYKHKVE